MTTLLYDRVCRVTLRRTVQTETEQRFFLEQPSEIVISDLRVEFEVTRNLGKSPNECKFTVTNLAPSIRAEVEGPPEGLVATLAAGHDNTPRHLFAGDVMLAYSEKDGADWRTHFTLMDGGRAFANAKVNRAYRDGTTMIAVLRDIGRAMGVTVPKEVERTPLAREPVIAPVIAGDVRVVLSQLIAPFGFSWSIQSGKLQLLRDSDTVGVIRELSEATGLIGSPAFERTKGGKKKASTSKMTAKCLLYPELTPGGVVRVESRQVNARFRVEQAKHTGDTHGDDWTTEFEAKELA
jgi:hypothetical protein